MKKVTQGGQVYYVSDTRWFLNRERTKLVSESNQEAHELYATLGTKILEEAAKQFGLLPKPKTKSKKPSKPKSAKPAEDKQLKPAEDKAAPGLKIGGAGLKINRSK